MRTVKVTDWNSFANFLGTLPDGDWYERFVNEYLNSIGFMGGKHFYNPQAEITGSLLNDFVQEWNYFATSKRGEYGYLEAVDVTTRPPTNYFYCDICELGFETQDLLKAHKLEKHPVTPPVTPPITPPVIPSPVKDTYICQYCSEIFGNMPDLIAHFKSKHGIVIPDYEPGALSVGIGMIVLAGIAALRLSSKKKKHAKR